MDIADQIRSAVDRALPSITAEAFRRNASSLQNAIRYQSNDARLAGKLKLGDALDQVIVSVDIKSTYEASLVISSDYFADADIGDDMKFYVDVSKKYCFD